MIKNMNLNYLTLTADLALVILTLSNWKSCQWKEPVRQHLSLAGLILLSFTWFSPIGIGENTLLHFVGLSLVTLVNGPLIASLTAISLSILWTSFSHYTWIDLPSILFIWGLLPVALTQIIQTSVKKYLPLNFFVYFFVTGFAGTILTLTITLFLWTHFLQISELASSENISRNLYSIFPMVIFGEAFLSGFVLAILIVFRPGWVQSFQDEYYLDFRKQL